MIDTLLVLVLLSYLFVSELPSTYSPCSPNIVLHSITLYLLSKGGFSPLLCPLELCHSPPPPQAVSNLSLYATHTFVFHYSLHYGISHLVRNSKCVINPWNTTMRQIDLVIEHITGRSKVFIIIFSNIEYLLNLYYLLGTQKT